MASEQYGFVFAVIFLTLFAGLTAMIPIDLQGQGASPEILVPVDPALVSDFSDHAPFDKTDFGGIIGFYHEYDALGGYDWACYYETNTFWVGAKVYWLGMIWLGGYDPVNWENDNGTIYDSVTFTDIDNDAVDGAVRYDLTFAESGQNAG